MTVKNKNVKMHRTTAKRYLDTTLERIKQYNAEDDNPLYIKKAVVFGSYINSDKEMLSDLDIALLWSIRQDWLMWEEKHIDEIRKFWRIQCTPQIDQTLVYMMRKALIQIRQRNMWVQFTSYNDSAEREIVHSDKYQVFDFKVE